MTLVSHLFYGIIVDFQAKRSHHLFFKRFLKNKIKYQATKYFLLLLF